MLPHVDIIIVTFDNVRYLENCLNTIYTTPEDNYTVHVVNNGKPGSLNHFAKDNTFVHDTGSNLGWMGGINFVRNKVNGPFVLLLNDDTQVIHFDDFLGKLLAPFTKYSNIGATGPISNNVSGYQFYNSIVPPPKCHSNHALIGFCLMVKKEYLDRVGWLDATLPGGDDLDLSIKLQDIGLSLAVCRDVTVLHFYGATGKRVHGDYWDSLDHGDKINISLIKKHGLKRYLSFMSGESMVHARKQ